MSKLSVIRNIVLLAIAIILVEAIIGQPMFLALLVVPFAYGWQQLRRKHEGESASIEKRFQTVEEAEAELGAPDGTILTDATRGNELAGNILVYHSRRLLVIDGVEVNMDDIADVATVNMATPYTPGDYHVVFTLREPRKDYIRLPVGKDAQFAMQVATDIIDSINGAHPTGHVPEEENPRERM